MTADTITVLRCAPQLRLAKLLKADGTFVDYDSPRHFSAYEHAVTDLDALAKGLRTLQDQPQQCVVRGALVDGPAQRGIRRLLHRDPETGVARQSGCRMRVNQDGLLRPRLGDDCRARLSLASG